MFNLKNRKIMATGIKQIETFYLAQLRIAALLEYLQQVAKLVSAAAFDEGSTVSKLPARVQPYHSTFATAVGGVDSAFKLSRASELTKQIADEDTRRDSLYTALKNQVQMYQKFDFDQEMKEAGTYLWTIMKKYAVDVQANYSEESGKLQQMLQELSASEKATALIAKLGLSALVAQLTAANEAVRTLMADRNDERTAQEKAALAKARAAATEAYQDLIAMLNAAALMDDDATRFDQLFLQINELIAYYRQHVVKAGKGKSSSSGDDDSDGDDSDDGGGDSDDGGGGSDSGGSDDSGGGGSDSGDDPTPTPTPTPTPSGDDSDDDSDPEG